MVSFTVSKHLSQRPDFHQAVGIIRIIEIREIVSTDISTSCILCAVLEATIGSTSEVSSTSGMCSMSADAQYERGFEAQARM